MILTVLERISIGTICPAKDNIDRLLIRKSIISKVEIKSEEAEVIELKQEGTVITWNDKGKEIEIEIEFSEVERNYLRNCINELSNKRELPANMVDLYQKINK